MGSGNSRPAPARRTAPVRAVAASAAVASVARAVIAPAPPPPITNLAVGESGDGSRTSLHIGQGISSSSVTIQRRSLRANATSDAFWSESTKLLIVPSIPFPMKFVTDAGTVDTPVSMMTLYHPCPLRIENVQYDAVLVLNDPSGLAYDRVVVIIPLQGSIRSGRPAAFVGKIAPFLPGAVVPEKGKGSEPLPVATGNDWVLTDVLPVVPSRRAGNMPEVAGDFFTWMGGGGLRRYVMMKQPLEINTRDLQTIRTLPITPPSTAIDQPPGYYPTRRLVFYKPVPPAALQAGTSAAVNNVARAAGVGCASVPPRRENFANGCNPLEHIAQPSGTFRLDSGQVITMLSTLVGIIAGVIAVYFALKMSVDPKYGKIVGALGAKIGKLLSGVTPRPPPAAPAPAAPAPAAPAPAPAATLSPTQLQQARAAEPDESNFEGVNPMRFSRGSTPRASINDRARNSLEGYRGQSLPPRRRTAVPPHLRARSTSAPRPPPTNEEIERLRAVNPTISPNQVQVAINQEPRRRRVETDVEENAQEAAIEKAAKEAEAKAKADAEAAKAKAEAKAKADAEAAKKAAEEAAAEAKKVEEKAKADAEAAEEAKLKAQDDAVKAQIRAQAPRVAALQADADRRSAAIKQNIELLNGARTRVEKRVAAKKAAADATKAAADAKKAAEDATKAAEDAKKLANAPPGTFSRLLKEVKAESDKKPSRFTNPFRKTNLSARATAATPAPQPETAPAPRPTPRVKTAKEEIFDARRDAAKRREGIAPRMPGGKNTRKNKHRK